MLLRNRQEAGFSGEVSISKAFHIYLSAFGNTLCLNTDPASKRPLNLSTFPQSDLNPACQVQGKDVLNPEGTKLQLGKSSSSLLVTQQWLHFQMVLEQSQCDLGQPREYWG